MDSSKNEQMQAEEYVVSYGLATRKEIMEEKCRIEPCENGDIFIHWQGSSYPHIVKQKGN